MTSTTPQRASRFVTDGARRIYLGYTKPLVVQSLDDVMRSLGFYPSIFPYAVRQDAQGNSEEDAKQYLLMRPNGWGLTDEITYLHADPFHTRRHNHVLRRMTEDKAHTEYGVLVSAVACKDLEEIMSRMCDVMHHKLGAQPYKYKDERLCY